MNIIGTFKKDGERYSGTMNTLKFSGAATIEPVAEKKSEESPDFRIFGGTQPRRNRRGVPGDRYHCAALFPCPSDTISAFRSVSNSSTSG